MKRVLFKNYIVQIHIWVVRIFLNVRITFFLFVQMVFFEDIQNIIVKNNFFDSIK